MGQLNVGSPDFLRFQTDIESGVDTPPLDLANLFQHLFRDRLDTTITTPPLPVVHYAARLYDVLHGDESNILTQREQVEIGIDDYGDVLFPSAAHIAVIRPCIAIVLYSKRHGYGRIIHFYSISKK
jgi:hypothetical protein